MSGWEVYKLDMENLSLPVADSGYKRRGNSARSTGELDVGASSQISPGILNRYRRETPGKIVGDFLCLSSAGTVCTCCTNTCRLNFLIRTAVFVQNGKNARGL